MGRHGIPRIDADDEDEDEEKRKETVLHDLVSDLHGFEPVLRRRPCLVVVGGNRSVGKVFRLRDGEMSVGRSATCDIVLEEDRVSRRHATVRVDAKGNVVIRDAGSSNGLYHGSVRVTEHPMTDGDRVEIGDAGVALLHLDDFDETVRRNLFESATEDDETRMLTRRYFKEVLAGEFEMAARYNVPLSVLICALDPLKQAPPAMGRTDGVNLLRQAARLVHDLVSREDVTYARYAEDQFALGFPSTDAADALQAASMLCKGIEACTFELSEQSIRMTMSVGVATGVANCSSVGDLLQNAERSLYQAKVAGGNRVVGS